MTRAICDRLMSSVREYLPTAVPVRWFDRGYHVEVRLADGRRFELHSLSDWQKLRSKLR